MALSHLVPFEMHTILAYICTANSTNTKSSLNLKKKREEYCGKRERELEIRTLNGSERYLFVQNASHNQKRNEQVEPALSISVGVETEQFTCVLFFR